ncbi:MAG: phosphodiester glycosidase family protein, partial [Planctomycetes bacterium]|nr:phosphodiester glycosidase family protein [Planctomycetota bacterium]
MLSVERAFSRALQWVSQPASEDTIGAFSPALDLRYRIYTEPKALRIWIARIDLNVPGVRLAVTEPADFTGDDGKFETRCANTLEFARQRGVQLAVNTSAFAPFRPEMGRPMDVVGLAAARGKIYSTADQRFGAMFVAPDGRVVLKGPPLEAAGVWHAVGGFRMLLDDQRLVVSADRANSRFGGVNPRTAVGVDRDG